MRLPRLFAGQALIRERDNALRSLKRVQEELRDANKQLTDLAWRPHLYWDSVRGSVVARGLTYRDGRSRVTLLDADWEDAPKGVRWAIQRFDDELEKG